MTDDRCTVALPGAQVANGAAPGSRSLHHLGALHGDPAAAGARLPLPLLQCTIGATAFALGRTKGAAICSTCAFVVMLQSTRTGCGSYSSRTSSTEREKDERLQSEQGRGDTRPLTVLQVVVMPLVIGLVTIQQVRVPALLRLVYAGRLVELPKVRS